MPRLAALALAAGGTAKVVGHRLTHQHLLPLRGAHLKGRMHAQHTTTYAHAHELRETYAATTAAALSFLAALLLLVLLAALLLLLALAILTAARHVGRSAQLCKEAPSERAQENERCAAHAPSMASHPLSPLFSLPTFTLSIWRTLRASSGSASESIFIQREASFARSAFTSRHTCLMLPRVTWF